MTRRDFTASEALDALAARGSEANRRGMERFGIAVDHAYGVTMPDIRAVAAGITPNHALAEAIWQSGIHEARILAALVDRPRWVTVEQMDRWTADFDSWDICDQVCGNLWDRAAGRDERIAQWSGDEREFVRRAAFATIAWRAVHDKKAPDAEFSAYFPLIEAASHDPRNFVKKAVNWALRQIGKRSIGLNAAALSVAASLASAPAQSARWIAREAIRELASAKVRKKLGIAGPG